MVYNLWNPGKAIPCVDLLRDIATFDVSDANFDVCCNKTGDCRNTKALSLD